MSSPPFDNKMQTMLEDLFEMRGGYVLDFTNDSFTSFIDNCLGFDPYSRYQGSKAKILRSIWAEEPPRERGQTEPRPH